MESIAPKTKSRRAPSASKSTTKRKVRDDPVEPTNGQKKKATTNGQKKKAAEQPASPPSNVTTTIGNKKSPPELQQKSPPAFEPSPKMSNELTESTTPDKEKPDEMDIDDTLGRLEDTPSDALSDAPSDTPSDAPSNAIYEQPSPTIASGTSTSPTAAANPSKLSAPPTVSPPSASATATGPSESSPATVSPQQVAAPPAITQPTKSSKKAAKKVTKPASLTVDAAVKGIEVKTWPSRIIDDRWAQPKSDGTCITCVACLGRGRTKGVIQMRWPYCISAWDGGDGKGGHCNTEAHTEAVAFKLREEDRTKKRDGKQKSMLNFFSTKKKSDDKGSSNSQGGKGSTSVDVVAEDGVATVNNPVNVSGGDESMKG
jgi:hypothetical protein